MGAIEYLLTAAIGAIVATTAVLAYGAHVTALFDTIARAIP